MLFTDFITDFIKDFVSDFVKGEYKNCRSVDRQTMDGIQRHL